MRPGWMRAAAAAALVLVCALVGAQTNAGGAGGAPSAAPGPSAGANPAQSPAQNATPFLGEKKIALLIGISAYPPESGFPALHYAAKDAEDVGAVLAKQGYTTIVLTDQHAMRDSIRLALQQVHDELNANKIGTNPSGTIVFMFSGHGGETAGAGTAQQYLVTYDASAQDSQPGYPLKDITNALNSDGAARVMMFVDACRDETGASKGAPVLTNFDLGFMQAEGTKALFSTAPGHQSYEDAQAQNGYFTHYLLEGLNGQAASPDGLITFDGLAKWVTQALENDQTIDQVPYWNQNASGDFYLAGHLLNKEALVIGVDGYSGGPIQGAVAGAQQVELQLANDGFRTTYLANAKAADFKAALSNFAKDLGPDDVALFYFAGEGGIASGNPFLMAADGMLPTQATGGKWVSAPANAILVRDVVSIVSQNHPGPNVYLLDTGLKRASAADGLNLASLMRDKTLVLFSCKGGQDPVRTATGSLFSSAVASVLAQPNMTAGYAASKIVAAIFSQTEGVQYAVEVPMLPDRVYLTPSQ